MANSIMALRVPPARSLHASLADPSACAASAALVRAGRLGPTGARAYAPAMDLPPGPRAPSAWQTVAWMARPAAFLQGVHRRFGDPATIRTYWTEEPMVLFSHPDAVREIF